MSWMSQAWKVFEAMPRAVDYRDIADRTGMSDRQAQNCICRFLAAKCIVFVGGSARAGRKYVRVVGAQPPEDQRGKTPEALAALEKARKRRHASPAAQLAEAKSVLAKARRRRPVSHPSRLK